MLTFSNKILAVFFTQSYSQLSPPPTDWRRQSFNRTDAKVPEGGYVLAPKGWSLYWRRGWYVLAPRVVCTGAKGGMYWRQGDRM